MSQNKGDKNADSLCFMLNEAWPGQFVTQHMGIQDRKFCFDVANVGKRIAIDIDGGLHPFYATTKTGHKILVQRGGHSSNDGIERDMEKGNAAQLEGWKYLRYSTNTLKMHPYKIIKDLWIIMGEPTGKKSIVVLEASLKRAEKNHTRLKVSMKSGQKMIA